MKIAVFTKNFSNPAYAAARIGAERAADAFGPGVEVQHHVPETPDDAAQQIELVDQALAGQPDAFVFTPVHPTKIDAALDRVQAAGVPLFGFVNRMAPGRCISYAGSSDTALAADIARHLFTQLRGRGRVVVVEGPADSPTSIERVTAFDTAARDFPNIELAARCSGAYQREPARAAFAQLLAQHAQIDGVLVANDIMAIGVVDALRDAQRQALVVGVNAIPQAIDAIRAGEMLATADFNAMQMCALATESAIRHLRGERVPAEIELPVAIVDRHNAHHWDLPYAQRPLLTLKDLAA